MKKPLFEHVDCISMTVSDLEEGLAFYQDALGLKLLWKTETVCGLGMQDGAAELVLTTEDNPMVDLKVDDVLAAVPLFVAAGGKVEVEPFDIDVGKCAVVVDPWGNKYCMLDTTKGTYDVDENKIVNGVSKK